MGRRRHAMGRLALGRARGGPIVERPRFLLGVEAAEAADLRQELAEAVAEVHQPQVRRAIDQAVNQLHHHQRAEQELGHLPHQGKYQHPQDAQGNGFVLGRCFRIVHGAFLS